MTRFWPVAVSLAFASAANASETLTYTYDARGRLTQVGHAGTVNQGVVTCYTYDKADNRSKVVAANQSCTAPVPPSFAIANDWAYEGNNLYFWVTKTGLTGNTTTVNYATANGTAIAGSDYTAVTGTLTFAPSETSKRIIVPTTTDIVVEPDEAMTMNLSGAVDATISDASASGGIHNND